MIYFYTNHLLILPVSIVVIENLSETYVQKPEWHTYIKLVPALKKTDYGNVDNEKNGDGTWIRPFCREQNGTHAVRPQGGRQGILPSTGPQRYEGLKSN